MLTGKTVVLGISGSIAAYKIAYLASALKKLHADDHDRECHTVHHTGDL